MKNIRYILFCLLMLLCGVANVQSQSINIVIGGDVYGGGREGAVGTKNAQAQTINAAKESVKLIENAENNPATEIKVYNGTIRTIFGGGENGRTFGSTSVLIQGSGTTIGKQSLKNTMHGGVFGAGDGEHAFVFGHSNVTIKGGTIAQNVYGGGNQADLIGTTEVLLQGGTFYESVFGGSRLANIFGYSLVNIDGAHATQDLVIKAVYGGNDIAGIIQSSNNWDWTLKTKLKLPENLFSHDITNKITGLNQNNTYYTDYNSFVHSTAEANNKHIFVGQVFGGGNGDYGNYVYNSTTQKYAVSALGTSFDVTSRPQVERSYIELQGGTYGYIYGGGNAAPVTTNVDICLDNSTTSQNLYAIHPDSLAKMGVSTNSTFTAQNDNKLKPTYQFDRVFGGNNKADMGIQPKWHLMNATINNLYSGGNEGDMTYKDGLLLVLDDPDVTVNTVYGGSRRANVDPRDDQGNRVANVAALDGYDFPAGFSARVLITAGTINNVYGGNDISGDVFGGNALDIRSNILGDVYGGGNGSYVYTDNANLANHKDYRDFYYTIPQGKSSVEALNDFRPNAQQAWIHVSGTEQKPTLIGGSLYCGGNSATLSIGEGDNNKRAELNIGSYVVVDNVFLGSNGANMIDNVMLAKYHNGTDDGTQSGKLISTIDMSEDFAEYIKGVSLGIRPTVSFEDDYVTNSTQIGSFFVGGNLGSITASGKFDVTFEKAIIIYDKLVAGCNDANYENSDYNIHYKGGITNNNGVGQDGVKIQLNIDNITLLPKKIRRNNGAPVFDNDGKPILDWNITTPELDNTTVRRLKGANIYGGCYASGYVNGGVVININGPAMHDDDIFDTPESENSGIEKEVQQQDVFGRAMSVFGGGKGPNTEIWGHTTINIAQTGYILQAFGGGEEGLIGKDLGNGNYTAYNTTVNLNGGSVDEVYGGGFEGYVSGNTTVNVYSGNAVDVFGGACNANVGGYASVYIGGDANGASNLSIPVVQNVFGGNDYSGSINGTHSHPTYGNNTIASNTYVEYLQGQVDSIFGGSYGSYPEDYEDGTLQPPFVESTFVNFKGNNKNGNKVGQVFGGGWGDPEIATNNEMQQRSYVLVNSAGNTEAFATTDIFGAGAFSGLGMNKTPVQAASAPAQVTARVDLVSGKVHDVYGSSYKSGFTRRTEVNVPSVSTVNVYNIFGGGFGEDLGTVCDTYEATVNYNSENATVRSYTVKIDDEDVTYSGAIYGGNNNSRRTLYSFINIESPVYSNKTSGYTAKVYGAGYGKDTWTQYTEVNLNNGANVYEVYGGGYGGMVLNKESVNAFDTYTYKDKNNVEHNDGVVAKAIGSGYDATDQTYDHGGLDNALVSANRFPVESGDDPLKTNTNVYIWKGATVGGYAYGAGLGKDALVSGTAYIGVHGGTVVKDLYAAGTSGAVDKKYSNLTFTPETYGYLEGGSVRNIYGGGWEGEVGYHDPTTYATTNDRTGYSHVIIGILPEDYVANDGYNEPYGFYKGVPTVQRNAYAGGEGGAVRGKASLILNNGYVGYEYNTTTGQYDEKIEDNTYYVDGAFVPNTNLAEAGNVFGGGYAEKSDVDESSILMLGGQIRNSLYGGGEIATVGRGRQVNGSTLPTIDKVGETHVKMYAGKVLHDVFGGGRGYDNLGRVGKNLHTDGYVFGSTEVYIYGGEVGTNENASQGYGNVFGGGNVGYVYSGSGKKNGGLGGHALHTDGYYYDADDKLTEDCKVVVTPYAKVLANEGITLSLLNADYTVKNTKTFAKNEYVPTEYLNCMTRIAIEDDKDKYKKLDWVTGVTIHNAVFAGGNVSSGSNAMYANTKTVFGNATAVLNDVYNYDLITIGTEHIGGLYGDGNLTFVDGYREINITNYGTAYYGQNEIISIAKYESMNDRERAYFEVRYTCKEDFQTSTKTFTQGEYCTETEILEYFYPEDDNGDRTYVKVYDPETGTDTNINVISVQNGTITSDYWEKSGFCNIYAGRLLNTLQRADFVGVFGSRMVLQGARDRVPAVVDHTNYTINRVGEVSLNRKKSPASATDKYPELGNYFGIYNIVNYLGALTSDVDLQSERNTDATSEIYQGPAGQTYQQWKNANIEEPKIMNNGSSANKVALAAGVYLEITKEGSTPENKIWGEATGVMELDLINVMTGLGGGYVYAKNVHGTRDVDTSNKQITLSTYNTGAISNKMYSYDGPDQTIQTSGNFVHSTKQIFDDCYPESDDHNAGGHYWFIKGQIYIYNQYISAYTGAADAYEKTINIPLTITAGAHGTLKLQNVQPNKYAYYSYYASPTDNTKLTPESYVQINGTTYHLNDTITYWDWSMLSETDQPKFVDETYVTIAECKYKKQGEDTETVIPKGSVFLPAEYTTMMNQAVTQTIENVQGVHAVYHTAKEAYVPFTDVFRSSNNISHENGYILAFDMSNPADWDSYRSPYVSGNANYPKILTTDFNELSDEDKDKYLKTSVSYTPDYTQIYGQRSYTEGTIIPYNVWNTYEQNVKSHLNAAQAAAAAVFERAYVLTEPITIQNQDLTETHYNAGLVVSYTQAGDLGIQNQAHEAQMCIDALLLSRDGYDDELIYYGRNMTEGQIRELVKTYICYQGETESQITDKTNELINSHFTASYYCKTGGLYGGDYYEAGHNYSALSAWSAMTPSDRSHFTFNYDALDVLIDSEFRGPTSYDNDLEHPLYSEVQALDYTAKYLGSEDLIYTNKSGQTVTIVTGQQPLKRLQYEAIPNEQSHFAPFVFDSDPVYIVRNSFLHGDVPFSVGNKIDADTYESLGQDMQHVDIISGLTSNAKYYYCRESYPINEKGEASNVTLTAQTTVTHMVGTTDPHPVTSVTANTQKSAGDPVPVGFVITQQAYESLPNKQLNFSIHGTTPNITSTFYVSGQSNMQDLSRGKVMTIIYQYNYEESDKSGSNVELITERHIINIYLRFQSGTPSIAPISEPSAILPGSSIALSTPQVKSGAYEVIGGGWELFPTQEQADRHVNGMEFNDKTKLYWYQNNKYYLSYYAKTYLGKTYSNAVPVKIVNYHDLDMIMRDKEHHMYIDNPNVARNSKIYIDGRKCTSDPAKSELDLLKDLFDLSLVNLTTDPETGDPVAIASGELTGHVPMNSYVSGLENLEFIMRGNVAPKKYTTWSPIGSGNDCFEGNLHGDGYTISGLDHSLFGSLCGNVYNLGVTGTFTGSGISDNGGYAENCWIMTTGTISNGTKAVIGGSNGVAKNCYYPDNLNYNTSVTGTNAMPESAFRNGTVAYNLNGFYLDKRYADNNAVSTNPYKYYTISNNTTNTLNTTPSTGGYSNANAIYTYGTDENTKTLGYVESRYIDGDYVFAGGTIPTSSNERRYYVAPQSGGSPDPDNGLYYPIWPDDYIFFGQMLTYGYTESENIVGRDYQSTPSRINKADRPNATQWLVRESNDEFSNRVYRAPAYYGSKNPDIVHYNAYAVIPAKTSDGQTDIYPNLTAIDFTAASDYNNNQLVWNNGWSGNVFNKRVLDHNGLISFRSDGQTLNLLVYAEDDDDELFYHYFDEPSLIIGNDYKTAAVANNNARGHLVLKTDNGYEADGNHFLVDGEDFNAPISYSFGQASGNSYYHMWYQRTPGVYVNSAAGGWETVSLPFTAEMVTTQNKGEITHFYTGSTIGHEYWLRELNKVETDAQDNTKTNTVFRSLAVGSTTKAVSNKFLYDYYYYNTRNSQKNLKDKNDDTYWEYYKDETRSYANYPRLTAGKPYLIGFPGKTYYEFDLSGQFSPKNTATGSNILPPQDLPKQVVTFVSVEEQVIGVTDDVMHPAEYSANGYHYTFVPTYQTKTAQSETLYLMADDGKSFEAAAANATTVPFRAYMTAATTPGGVQQRAGTRADALFISYAGDGSDSMEETVTNRGLTVYGQHMTISIESNLEQPATVTITTAAGKILKQFTIQPATRVTVPVNSRGIYIVNRHKIAVTK